MKFLKLFFTRMIPTLILFAVQIAFFVLPVIAFRDYYAYIDVAARIVGLILFIVIVNKRETPEFKIPWTFLVLVFPLFGVIAYILFANPGMSKRYARLHKKTENRARAHVSLTSDEKEKVRSLAGDKAGVFNYLESNSYLPTTAGNRVTYYELGEKFWEALLCELRSAQKFIFMEYFIIDKGEMWDSIHEILVEKAKAGVEVRFLYDDVGSLKTFESNYYKKLRREGILCFKFNPLKPALSGIYNNRDHRKITVVDGRAGFTGGINLGDEYVNRVVRFGHWKDTAIKIEGRAVANLTALFLQTYDAVALKASDYKKYLDLPYEVFDDDGIVNFFGDGPKPYYDEQIGKWNYINLINSAKKYVYITTPYLITDATLMSAIANAAARGLDVLLVTPHIPDKKTVFNMTRSNYAQLQEKGVKIYEYTPGFIHAKMLVADDDIAFVGTINLDYRSLVHHYECGAVMYKTPCIKAIKDDVVNTVALSQEMTPGSLKIGKFARVVRAIVQVFAPML